MIVEKRTYHPLVSDLEEKVSYGTLGILETLVHHFNDQPHLNRKILLVNGDTIIRNCYHKDLPVNTIYDKISFDFEKLIYYYRQYVNEGIVIIYFHPGIYGFIPQHLQKKLTPLRENLTTLSNGVISLNSVEFNKVRTLSDESVKVVALAVKGKFSYKSLLEQFRSLFLSNKIWMISHCPIDYFLFQSFDIELINSHTGIIITKKDLGKKVFGESNVPFNKTSLMLFGDKEFIRPLCRNKPKALLELKSNNIHLRTERELAQLAVTKLKIDRKSLLWDF
jgi:hypothetical protein